MDYHVEHARFAARPLVVRTHPLLAPKLLIDGVEQKRSWGKFEVTDDDGAPAVVKVRNGFDLSPRVIVDDAEPIKLGEGLPWYGYLFSYAPIVLLVGGAIGGGLGALAVICNISLFRTELPTVAKIGASVLVTIAAVIAYVIAAGVLHVLVNG